MYLYTKNYFFLLPTNMFQSFLELCQYALHSSITGKSVNVVFFLEYLEDSDVSTPDQFEMKFHDCTLVKCGGLIDAKEKEREIEDETEEEQVGTVEYKHRMACIFAMVIYIYIYNTNDK